MGFEKSEPRNKVILISAVGSALTLAGLVPVFHSYFNAMVYGELEEKYDVASSEQASIEEKQALVDGAPLSLDDAVSRIASGNRRGTSVQPRPTDNFDAGEDDSLASLHAVKGWSARDAVNGWSARERVRAEAHARDAVLRLRAREQARRDAAAAAALLEADPSSAGEL